jgi:putative spermidine/putrescine transport system permease protein
MINKILYRIINTIFVAYYWIVIVFLLFPILIVFPISFVNSKYLEFPPKNFSFRWYINYFNDAEFFVATFNSIYLGLAATIVATCVGTMAAIGLSKTNFIGKKIVFGFLITPLVFPLIILALGLYIFLARFDAIENFYMLIIAHSALVMPFSLIIVSTSLQSFDVTLERSARVLGANPWQAFWKVTLPYIKPAVYSSAIFGFFVSFDELIIALFISGKIWTLPQRVWQDLRYEIDPTIAAVAAILIAVTFVGILLGTILQKQAMRFIEK